MIFLKTFADREVGTDYLYATFFYLLTRRKYSLKENVSRLMPFDIANCLIFVTFIFSANLVQLIGRYEGI